MVDGNTPYLKPNNVKDFLQRIGLIDNFTIDLPIQKAAFVERLRQNVSPNGHLLEAFSGDKNIYKGSVDLRGFRIKRRRRLFDTRQNFAVASGTFSQLGDELRVDTEVNGFHWSMTILFVFIILIYIASFVVILLTGGESGADENLPLFILPFILLHAVLMLAIPYLVLKNSVRWMKHDLQREFYFLTKA